jgi:hypothetical protein
MRDYEELQSTLDRLGFDEWHSIDSLPSIADPGDVLAFFADDGYLAHGTTVQSASAIIEEGLLPRSSSLCEIWDDKTLPRDSPEYMNHIMNCRSDSVYLYNNYKTALEQAIASVAQVEMGNPAFLVVDGKGLDLEIDPELERDVENPPLREEYYGPFSSGLKQYMMKKMDDSDEPTALMHEGEIEKERVRCVCYLKEKWLPTVGETLCANHALGIGEKNCYLLTEQFYEQIQDDEEWECRCKGKL